MLIMLVLFLVRMVFINLVVVVCKFWMWFELFIELEMFRISEILIFEICFCVVESVGMIMFL